MHNGDSKPKKEIIKKDIKKGTKKESQYTVSTSREIHCDNTSDEMHGLELKIAFGKNVKSARKDLGLTQKDLATLLNVSQQYISHIELGEIPISIGTMAKIASILKRNVPQMLET